MLIGIRPESYLKKLSEDGHLDWNMFLISIKPKKCVSVVSEDPFLIVNFPDKYKAQRMCDETVDDSLAVLKLFPIDLLQVK